MALFSLSRNLRKKGPWILGTVILLIAIRASLPPLVQWYVNKVLNEIPGYRGHIGDVDIQLWRGAYEIQDVSLDKISGQIPAPFISAEELDLSIEWKAILEGSLVGEVDFNALKVNFVEGKSEEESQDGESHDFVETVKKLFPLRINRFSVQNGEVHFRNFSSDPVVDIYIDSLSMLATNLTNSRRLSGSLFGSISAEGKVMGEARFDGSILINPLTHLPTFSLDCEVEGVDLTKLNDFFEAYANIDVESGTISIFSELAAENGTISGYVKPLFKDMNVVDLEEDVKQPLKLIWEALVEAATLLFTNVPEGQLGTKIPLSGTLDDPDADILSTIGELLKNAFIKALEPGIEGTVRLETVHE